MKRTGYLIGMLSILLVIGGVGTVVLGQTTEQVQAGATVRTLTVDGMGSSSGAPDVAHIQLGVDVVNLDPAVAYANANTQIEALKEALLAMDIASGDIQTTNFNLWWNDQYNPETGTPTGVKEYHVQHTINVTVRDISQVGSVIGSALKVGANSIYGLSFSIDDPTDLTNEARVLALADGQARAEHMAETIGVSLGKIISVREGISYQQSPFYGFIGGRGGGGGDAPISEGQLTVDLQVTVTYEITD